MVSQLLWKSCHRLGFWLQFVQMPYGYFWNRSLPGHDGGMSRLPLRAHTFSELLSLVTSVAVVSTWDLILKTSDAPPRDGTPPGGGGSMADPLRKNTDSSRQGSPPNDGVLVLRFRPIRRFWRIMSKSAFSTISWKYHIRVHFWHSMLFRYSEIPPVIDIFTK